MKKCNNCGELHYKKLYDFDYKGETFYSNKSFSPSVFKCLRCGLIILEFDKSAENRDEIHDFWWSKTWLATYSKFKQKMERNYRDKLRFLEHKVQGKKILDVGCGCGFFLSTAKKEGWDTVGLDISQSAVNHAKGNLGLQALHSTISKAKFPDNSFDLITMWDVVEHLDEPSQVFNEINRVLKPGGLLVIETPNAKSLIHLITDISYRLSSGRLKYFVSKIYIPAHLYYFSKRTLNDMLQRNGFVCDERKIPFKSLFDDLDIIFSANESKERWAKSKVFKFLVNLQMKFSEAINMPYRLMVLARKKDD